MPRTTLFTVLISLGVVLGLAAALSTGLTVAQNHDSGSALSAPADQPAMDEMGQHNMAATVPNVEYTLVTGGGTGQLVFVGQGGEIDGQTNPTLHANPGDLVRLTLINGDGMLHDLAIDEFNAKTPQFSDEGRQEVIEFIVDRAGEFTYYCSVPGHRQAGMAGKLVVGQQDGAAAAGANIVHNPSDLPGPVGDRAPQTVHVELVAQEVIGQLADGTTMTYFTFNGSVPGPFIRARVGDTIEVLFRNETHSQFPHSVDFHAATGPGGGAVFSNLAPGAEATFSFKALNPGLFVYHCATPSVAHHIASGMYGMILVEPEGGLAPVDHEFYVMQGEIYTQEPFGTTGYVNFSHEKMLNEAPEYFVFNGAANALTQEANMLHAQVGDTVRIFFGVGGPNFTSSFHVIGEIFDRVYDQGSLTSAPLTDVQTTLVPPGGATMVEFQLQVPGRFILVDHALSRMERGLMGYLMVDGDPRPDLFEGTPTAGSGH